MSVSNSRTSAGVNETSNPLTIPRGAGALAWVLLAVWGGLVLLTQPMSDDFWFAHQGRDLGWWSAWVGFYQTWNGRWLANAGLFALHLGGDLSITCRTVLLLVLIGFLTAVAGVFRCLMGIPTQIVPLALVLFCWAWCALAPMRALPFWTSGALNYLVSGLVALSALVAVARGWKWAGFLAGFLVAAGCEILVLPAMVAVMLTGFRQPRSLPWKWALAGVLLGAVVVGLAPGNAHRLVALGGLKPSALEVLPSAVTSLLDRAVPLLCTLLAVVAMLRAVPTSAPGLSWGMLGWPILAIILTMLTWAPAVLGIGTLDLYVESAGVLVFLLYLAPWLLLLAAWLAWWTRPGAGGWPVSSAIVMMVLLGVVLEAPVMVVAWGLLLLKNGALRPVMKWGALGCIAIPFALMVIEDGYVPGWERELVWSQRRAILDRAGERGDAVVVLPPLPASGGHPKLLLLTELASSPEGPWNRDAAAWYRVGAIWVVPDPDPHAMGMGRWWQAVDRTCKKAGQSSLIWDPR